MIKSILQKREYLIYDDENKTGMGVHVVIADDEITLTTDDGKKQFIFDSDNTIETIQKWRKVLELLKVAIDQADDYSDKKAHLPD